MHRLHKIVFVLLACSFGSFAFATSSVTGLVSNVRVDATGHGMVFFSVTISGSPSCISSNYNNAFAFDANTVGGRTFVALAMTAKASGDAITAFGLGTCNIYSGYAEDFDYGSSN
jgi:hypothetical protein